MSSTNIEEVVPALESGYAIKAVIDEALKGKGRGESPTILVNISGSGYLDFPGYREVIQG